MEKRKRERNLETAGRAKKKKKKKKKRAREKRRRESEDSGRAGLIEFYGNAAYISTFSLVAAKEIREAAEKLF